MYYQTIKLFPGLTRIVDVAGTLMYLVEGTERALLIDTGVGVENLKTLVDQLTDKPLTVVITHGHVDHAMGAGAFEGVPVYLSHLDQQIYEHHRQLEQRMNYVAFSGAVGPFAQEIGNLTPEDYLPTRPFSDFLDLKPGDSFALGGVTVQVMPGRGHTPGCVTLLIPEWRILLLGDACNEFTFLFDDYCSTVEDYRSMLLELKAATDGTYDRVIFSHNDGEGNLGLIDGVLAVCDDVLQGKADNMPFHDTLAPEGTVVAKEVDFSRFCRADEGCGNLVYNPRRVRSSTKA